MRYAEWTVCIFVFNIARLPKALHSEYAKLFWNMPSVLCKFAPNIEWSPKAMHSECARLYWNMPSELCKLVSNVEWLLKAMHSEYAKLFWNMQSYLCIFVCFILGKHCQRTSFSPEDPLNNSDREYGGHFVKQRRALSLARGTHKMAPWLKASRGFEPRSLDSGSRVLTITPRRLLWLVFLLFQLCLFFVFRIYARVP